MANLSKGTLLLTGANGGLGLALARCLLENGHSKLALHYRSSKTELESLLSQHGLPAEQHLFQGDLTREADVRQIRESIENKLGPVSVLINLAGVSSNGMSWKLSLEEFRSILDANLISTFLCCREFISGMRDAAWGRIINVSSVVASTGVAGASHYCAAKAGIEGLTRAFALELSNKKITVNALALGYFDRGLIHSVPEEIQMKIKEKIPVARFGSPSEIHGLVEYLVSDAGSYITGQVLHINGGLRL